MDYNEIIAAVVTLNDEIFEHTADSSLQMEVHSNGTSTCIKFLGLYLWNDDDDERVYLDPSSQDEELEPLDVFLRREAWKKLKKLGGLWAPAGTGVTQAEDPSEPEGITLTQAEFKEIRDALYHAKCDIWQTARVSERNLTGKDPNFPDGEPLGKPDTPLLIRRDGLDESYGVCDRLATTLKMMHAKTQSPKIKTTNEQPTDTGYQQALTLRLPTQPESRQLWSFQGPCSVLHEVHDDGCTCSYCCSFASQGHFGLQLPDNKGKTSWRIIWLRLGGNRHYLRWTLPRHQCNRHV